MQAIGARFRPEQAAMLPVGRLSDTSCYTAATVGQFTRMVGLKLVTTPVVCPQRNGIAESFVKTFKSDYAHLTAT